MDFGLFIILLCLIFFGLPILSFVLVVFVMEFFDWLSERNDEQEKRTPRP
jgi:hypothetical protein